MDQRDPYSGVGLRRCFLHRLAHFPMCGSANDAVIGFSLTLSSSFGFYSLDFGTHYSFNSCFVVLL